MLKLKILLGGFYPGFIQVNPMTSVLMRMRLRETDGRTREKTEEE